MTTPAFTPAMHELVALRTTRVDPEAITSWANQQDKIVAKTAALPVPSRALVDARVEELQSKQALARRTAVLAA
jgi:hypothetical protein